MGRWGVRAAVQRPRDAGPVVLRRAPRAGAAGRLPGARLRRRRRLPLPRGALRLRPVSRAVVRA
jgi:hypothetical protein